MSHALRASLIAIALMAASGQTACFGGGPSPTGLRKTPEFHIRPDGSTVLAEKNNDADSLTGNEAEAIDLVGTSLDARSVVSFFADLAAARGWPELSASRVDGFDFAGAWKVGKFRMAVYAGANTRADQFPGYPTVYEVHLIAASQRAIADSIKPTPSPASRP